MNVPYMPRWKSARAVLDTYQTRRNYVTQYVDTVVPCPECGDKQEVQGYGVRCPGEFELVCEKCGHKWTWPDEPEPYEKDA